MKYHLHTRRKFLPEKRKEAFLFGRETGVWPLERRQKKGLSVP